jgi:hypothetical protein
VQNERTKEEQEEHGENRVSYRFPDIRPVTDF